MFVLGVASFMSVPIEARSPKFTEKLAASIIMVSTRSGIETFIGWTQPDIFHIILDVKIRPGWVW